MGFDDILFDNRIEEKTKTMLNELIGCYDYENWDDLESMETGTQTYSAYSLIWLRRAGAARMMWPPRLNKSQFRRGRTVRVLGEKRRFLCPTPSCPPL